MPLSRPELIAPICNIMLAGRPKAILDVGMGAGVYGFLARQYVDLWFRGGGEQREDCLIDGIDVFSGYVGSLQRRIYNTITIGDAMQVVPNITRLYDMILLVDVIEHLSKDDGVKLVGLLRHCLEKSGGIVLTTPRDFREQGPVFGNDHERHLSHWTAKDLHDLGAYEYYIVSDHYQLVLIGHADMMKLVEVK